MPKSSHKKTARKVLAREQRAVRKVHEGLRGLAPIARTLAFHPADGGQAQDVSVSIGVPECDGRDWTTTVVIEFAGTHKETMVPGVDGIQCVIGALFLLPTLLSSTLPKGRLTFLGGDDLGFTRH